MKTILKLGKVLSTIAFVVSIVIVVFCVLSLLSVKTVGTGPIAQVGNTTIYGVLSDIGIAEEPFLKDILIIMAVFSAASLISGFVAMRFFAKELKESTLFNSECGKRCRTTGILIAVVNAIAVVICGALYTLHNVVFDDYLSMNTSAGLSFVIGIGFIICSVIIESGHKEMSRSDANGTQKR